MNDWIKVLEKQCEETSQRKVAELLRQRDGFPSHAIINKAIAGTYPDSQGLFRLKILVEDRFMNTPTAAPPDSASEDDEDWIAVLRAECAKTSQIKVAAALRNRSTFPSPTVINQVLSGKYPSQKGRDHLGDLVRGQYMGATVDCPVLNEIGLHQCAYWQAQPFMAINPLRTQMHRACRKCPNRREDQ